MASFDNTLRNIAAGQRLTPASALGYGTRMGRLSSRPVRLEAALEDDMNRFRILAVLGTAALVGAAVLGVAVVGVAPAGAATPVAGSNCPSGQPSASAPGTLTPPSGRPSNYPMGQCELLLASGQVPAGGTVTVTGGGYQPESRVHLSLRPAQDALGSVAAGQDGSFTDTVTIPSSASAGSYTVAAAGTGASGSPMTLTAELTVTAPHAASSTTRRRTDVVSAAPGSGPSSGTGASGPSGGSGTPSGSANTGGTSPAAGTGSTSSPASAGTGSSPSRGITGTPLAAGRIRSTNSGLGTGAWTGIAIAVAAAFGAAGLLLFGRRRRQASS